MRKYRDTKSLFSRYLVPVISTVVVVAVVIVVANAWNAEESTTITMGRGKGEKSQLLNSGSWILDSLLTSESAEPALT
jgi:hypothetical protein